MNWKKRYENWSIKPLNYNFNRTFFLVSVIYFLSVLFDFCFTYVTRCLDSDGFFMYEICSFLSMKDNNTITFEQLNELVNEIYDEYKHELTAAIKNEFFQLVDQYCLEIIH